MVTFTPTINPTWNPSREKAYRNNQTNFGDGYDQIVGDGIRTQKETWTLSWPLLSDIDAAAISDFFDARAGNEPFTWVTPDGATKKFTVPKHTKTPVAMGYWAITATFEESLNN